MAPDVLPERSAPWRWACGSLPSRCLLCLPRVHATDTPPREAPPSSTTLPQHLRKPEFPDSGWERIQELFHREEMQPYSEEVTNVVKSAVAAAMLGMVYGGLPAARHARERFIQQSHAEVFQSRMDAVRSAHNAAIRGFIRYGWRWSWRVAAFVTLFNTMSMGICVYRDEYAVSHYAAAGAITGGVFRLNLGLGGVMAGSAIGAMLGVPAGAVIMAMQKLAGETIRERRRRERRELYELKLEEWSARLQVTEDLINQMSSNNQDPDSDSELQKIQELLSLPRNEGVAKDSGGQ
ncbi:CC001 protein-like [Scleropages formosus]|uniref:Complex I assembly factor TIMMDC1, mitochondrial n=1 Tax=Scleropages formosus TaxID=113540 RepID=A0A0N8JXI9_SCLFO|nr:complex I assembly factor TIMMDC1, mitochondrial [Scleropages formosus]XP_018613211.1 complex I assembly factor TIMMDC1, mitochondrial [Scleropages formosus]KPP63865.1 CC001 protein-like [Scleropages formosus]